MRIYYAQGKEIRKIKEFINEYEPCYFKGDEDNKKERYTVPRYRTISLNTTQEYVEDEIITPILKCGIKEEIDVKHILAWKVGAIDMEKSGKDGIVYNPINWGNDDEINDKSSRPRYKNTFFKVKELSESIKNNSSSLGGLKYGDDILNNYIKDYCDQKKKDENNENKSCYSNIGIVYMITLLHFMTKGTVPIYDRFVHIALKAIFLRKKPGDTVFYSGPADNSYRTFLGLMDEYYYLIDNTVGKMDGKLYLKPNYKTDTDIYEIRSLDRALWVYGHMFNLEPK